MTKGSTMPTAVIVDAVRTPGGRRNGKLKNWHPVDLAAEALKAIASRNNLDPALVDDVIMGCVSQVGEQAFNVGRSAVLAAGWPESVPATTIDRQCGSSQQALHFAAQGVMSGAYDVVIAAGVEVMSRVTMGSSIGKDSGWPFGPSVAARYEPVGGLKNQGIGAEMIADQWDVSREDLDAFSAESHRRAAQATAEGRFANEIVPIYVRDAGEPEARVQRGWQGDRRQLFSNHRRRFGRSDHERGEGQGTRLHAARPVPLLRPRRRRPGHDADGPNPGDQEGSGARGPHARGHRPH
jgi:acetyl-CoA acetyltransferase family protein